MKNSEKNVKIVEFLNILNKEQVISKAQTVLGINSSLLCEKSLKSFLKYTIRQI